MHSDRHASDPNAHPQDLIAGELSVDLFASLDGYGFGGPGSPPYFGYGGPGLMSWITRQLDIEHLTLMGANTYRALSAIVAEHDDPSNQRMSELPKLVFSSSLRPPLSWANTSIVDEPVQAAIPRLKAEHSELPMRTIGSPSLVRSLFGLGLVDRVRLMVFPTIRGATGSQPVFSELPDLDLVLSATEVLDERVILLDYRTA
jgi:dihydrofolate reductase